MRLSIGDVMNLINEINKEKSLYNFKKLVGKYTQGKTQAVIEQEGYYDMENGGQYVEGKTETVDLIPAAVVPLSDDDLKFDEAGTYNDDNMKMYCYKHLEKSTKVKYEKNDRRIYYFTILSKRDYSDYDKDLQIYYMRRVDRDDKDN